MERYRLNRREALWLASYVAAIALTNAVGAAQGGPAAVTSGAIQMYWDGSPSGIDLVGPGTHLIAEDAQAPPRSMRVGDLVNVSRKITTSIMNHPVSVMVNGTSYSSVWVKGQFDISAAAFTVPRESVGTTRSFLTPMTMTGEFSAYTDRQMRRQVFSVSVSGSGVAIIGPMRAAPDGTYIMNSGGMSYQFSGPSPDEQPRAQSVR